MTGVLTRLEPRVTSPAPRDTWRTLLAGDPDALPDHDPGWLDAVCADGRFEDASRLYELADGRSVVLPLVRRRGAAGLGGWWASYPPAWGFGGLVGAGQDAELVRQVVDDLRRSGPARVWVRPDPVANAHWAAAAGPRVTVLDRCAHVVDLTGGPEAVFARMRKSTRRGIRLAQRGGVRIEVDRTGRLLPVHHELYRRSVDRWAQRQHEPPALAHWRARRRDPLAKLEAMARHLGESFVLVVAYVDDRPAVSAITLLGRTAHDTRAAMDREVTGRSRAGELVQWESLRLACEHGCTRHHLGESGRSVPLSEFKEGFGAVAVPYAEYRVERLPFTRVDAALRRSAKQVLGFRDA